MVTCRMYLILVFGCWVVSIPVMFFHLEEYHPIHEQKDFNYQLNPNQQDGFDKAMSGRADPDQEHTHSTEAKHHVWPQLNESDDRILAQMALNHQDGTEVKLILLHAFSSDENLPLGQTKFLQDECPVSRCHLTKTEADFDKVDLIVTKANVARLFKKYPNRPENQIIVWYQLESPMHSGTRVTANWTATYRRDSTINAPYYKFVPYKDVELIHKPSKNYAKGKTKKVAWFVSNCEAANGRGNYAEELAKYIDVDIYGRCGPFSCSRRNHENRCVKLLNRDYKFYLSFENSHCKDYITEKFFDNGLSNDIIPIAFGAAPYEYAQVAPPHSYIHTDDFESPRQLAEYLHRLDANDTLYNDFFRWKGSGEFINTKFWCRLCSMLHEAHSYGVRSWYSDFDSWWNGDGVCKPRVKSGWSSWRDRKPQYEDLQDTYHIEFQRTNE